VRPAYIALCRTTGGEDAERLQVLSPASSRASFQHLCPPGSLIRRCWDGNPQLLEWLESGELVSMLDQAIRDAGYPPNARQWTADTDAQTREEIHRTLAAVEAQERELEQEKRVLAGLEDVCRTATEAGNSVPDYSRLLQFEDVLDADEHLDLSKKVLAALNRFKESSGVNEEEEQEEGGRTIRSGIQRSRSLVVVRACASREPKARGDEGESRKM